MLNDKYAIILINSQNRFLPCSASSAAVCLNYFKLHYIFHCRVCVCTVNINILHQSHAWKRQNDKINFLAHLIARKRNKFRYRLKRGLANIIYITDGIVFKSLLWQKVSLETFFLLLSRFYSNYYETDVHFPFSGRR